MKILPEEVIFETNWFSSFIGVFEEFYFTLDSVELSLYDKATIQAIDGMNVQLAVQISPIGDMRVTKCVRWDLLIVVGQLGGLMYTIKNIGNAINRKAAAFASDNTLMRLLYSVNKREDPLFTRREGGEPPKFTQNRVLDCLQTRTSWYYDYKEYWKHGAAHSWCCCSCLNCCCPRRDTAADRIFIKGR